MQSYSLKLFSSKPIWPEKLKHVEATLASVKSYDFPQIILLENWN